MAPSASHPRLRWVRRCDPSLGPLLPNTRYIHSNRPTLHRHKPNFHIISKRILKHTPTLRTHTPSPPARNALPSARLKRLGPDLPPARTPPRLRLERPH